MQVIERFKEKLTTIIIDKQRDISATNRLDHEVTNLHQRSKTHRREAINKHHDQHPWIYSDYPKARSRPPSHN